MKLSASVLVIGGGPAGSTAARCLASAGIEVILLEKNTSFVKPCGGGISVNAFDEFAIPLSLIKRRVTTVKLVSPRGTVVEIGLGDNGLAIIERGQFDAALRAEAGKQGALVLEGEAISIERKRCYTVKAKGSEAMHEITADFIVGADGVNSRVRTLLGVGPVRSLVTVSSPVGHFESDCCQFWFGASHAPGAYSWIFPAGRGVVMGTGANRRGAVLSFFDRFQERVGIRSDNRGRVYRIPIWSDDLYERGNVLFVGDAAGQVLPLTLEGMYYAMKSAECAASSIIERSVRSYRKRWKDLFGKRFTVMEKLRTYFLKNDDAAEKLVDLHARPDVQEASLRLWFMKDSGTQSLREYARLFKKFLW